MARSKRRALSLGAVLGVLLIGSVVILPILVPRDSGNGLKSRSQVDALQKKENAEVDYKHASPTKALPKRRRSIEDLKSTLERKQERRFLEEFLEESGYSEEEWRELSNIMKKSAPYFWNMAETTLDKMLNDEERNLEWTSEVTDQTLAIIKERKVESTELKNLECGQSICRISFIHRDLESKKEYYNGPLDDTEWYNRASNAYGDQVTLEDGRVESYIYFSKNDGGEAFWELRRRIVKDVDRELKKIKT
jgi:hypothetical protein